MQKDARNLIPLFEAAFGSTPKRSQFHGELDRLWDQTFGPLEKTVKLLSNKNKVPKVNIYFDKETKQYVFDAYAPYASKDDIDIDIDSERVLTITINQKKENEVSHDDYILKEISTATQCRKFVIGEEIDTESVKASLKDGVLSLRFDQTKPIEPEQPEKKKITIS